MSPWKKQRQGVDEIEPIFGYCIVIGHCVVYMAVMLDGTQNQASGWTWARVLWRKLWLDGGLFIDFSCRPMSKLANGMGGTVGFILIMNYILVLHVFYIVESHYPHATLCLSLILLRGSGRAVCFPPLLARMALHFLWRGTETSVSKPSSLTEPRSAWPLKPALL